MTETGAPADDKPLQVASLAIESVNPAVLGVNPAGPIISDLVMFGLSSLGTLALRPDEVTLVITGNFVESVRARLPARQYRDEYTEERGAGMVGAKTMRLDDGRVQVLMHAWQFIDTDAARAVLPPDEADEVASGAEARAHAVRRTVVHEGNHVAMDQAGEDDIDLGDTPWARANFLNVAHQVIAEYRAELGVPSDLRSSGDSVDPLEGLIALRADLTRIAVVEYQEHLDVARLAYDVVQQSHHLWKVLAYAAAARRVGGHAVGAALPPEVTSTDEWQRMASEHWDSFEELLSDIPPGTTRVDRTDLSHWTAELADLLSEWLETFGFTWEDVGADTRFLITSWDLLN